MPKLQELDLQGNNFTDLDSLGSVFPSSLQVLNLRDNQLSWNHEGYSKFCGLINLQELDLSNNALTSMPNCLGNLSRLRTLELSNNQLDGNLSAFVSGLPPELEYLSLLGNNFNGSFLFNSLVNQTRLKIFKLSSKVGTIQAQAESPWVPLFQLKKLELHNLILGSTIPGFLVHQHDLFYVDLSYNKLTGKFPRWLVQNNTRLQYILLNNNLLTELQLPRRVHHGLQYLDISSNMIYGSIQEDVGIVFPKLVFMNFSSNQFHGTIPSSMGEMKSLETLDMSSNGLSGQLPKTFWSGCYSLVSLKLSNNQFQGKIFPEHANLTSLFELLLDGNNFTGCIGEGLLNSKELKMLDLSDNSFSGMVPLWMGSSSSLWYLYVSGNQLKGPFPHQLLQSLQLEVMDISHNSFSGSIPSNVNFSSLGQLQLQNNGFWGSIPDTLFTVEGLLLVDLRNNNFSGKIPNTIGESSSLSVLLLGNNSLQSHIPEKICQLSKIGILDLSHNMFNGVIPSCLGNLSFGPETYVSQLQSLEIYVGESFSPNWYYTSDLHSITDPRHYVIFRVPTVVDLLTKSRYDAYQGYILLNMYGLDLSSNRLSGEIPVEIGDLENIKSLNLSSNRLTGTIPYNISKLKDLESLDLSNNKLHGNIPPVLADLDSLGSFNVSCNNFSGEIPFKGHLVTFGERSYIGNAHLCGRPTNISCNPTRAPEANASTQDEEEQDDHVIDMEWFYWTCGAVYISTCLALFAFLCIDTRWSQEWFYRVDLFIHHLQRFKRSAFRN
uniref:LRR receptor-like serine/threonine-protein kinase GSO1 n=1 Tax=Noccaea caerulescens TaxID=107243 RepID=A0A1J3JUY3_NOCCA